MDGLSYYICVFLASEPVATPCETITASDLCWPHPFHLYSTFFCHIEKIHHVPHPTSYYFAIPTPHTHEETSVGCVYGRRHTGIGDLMFYARTECRQRPFTDTLMGGGEGVAMATHDFAAFLIHACLPNIEPDSSLLMSHETFSQSSMVSYLGDIPEFRKISGSDSHLIDYLFLVSGPSVLNRYDRMQDMMH